MNTDKIDDSSQKCFQRLRIIAIAELAIIVTWSMLTDATTPDARSYFLAWDTIMSGAPDHIRTPVYPLIVGALRALFGHTGGLLAVYLIQSIVFVISIGWLKELLDNLVTNRRIARWALIFYALYPGPLTMCGIILTESFAFTGTLGLVFLTYKAYTNQSLRCTLSSGAVMIILTLLRPALIYLPVAFLLFWIVIGCMKKSKLPVILGGMFSCMATFIALFLYCQSVTNHYGIKGPSLVSSVNNFFTIRQAGVMIPDEMPSPELRDVAEWGLQLHGDSPTLPQIYDEFFAMAPHFTDKMWNDYTSAAIEKHKEEIFRYMLTKRMADMCASDCVYGGSVFLPIRALTKCLSVNNGAALLMLLILMVMMVRHDIQCHTLDSFLWFLCGLTIMAYATVTVGAHNEWPRLLLPNYPVLLILFASFLTRVTNAACQIRCHY